MSLFSLQNIKYEGEGMKKKRITWCHRIYRQKILQNIKYEGEGMKKKNKESLDVTEFTDRKY